MAKPSSKPTAPSGRAVTLVLPDETYERLQIMCEANYRNVPQTLRYLIDLAYAEHVKGGKHNISTHSTVGVMNAPFRSGSGLSA